MPMLQRTGGPSPAREFDRSMTRALGEISETGDAFTVEVRLPGVTKDHIDISLGDRELAITGEIPAAAAGHRRLRTRRAGRFAYHVVLPVAIDAEGVIARLDGGLLTLILPKARIAELRHVAITD